MFSRPTEVHVHCWQLLNDARVCAEQLPPITQNWNWQLVGRVAGVIIALKNMRRPLYSCTVSVFSETTVVKSLPLKLKNQLWAPMYHTIPP